MWSRIRKLLLSFDGMYESKAIVCHRWTVRYLCYMDEFMSTCLTNNIVLLFLIFQWYVQTHILSFGFWMFHGYYGLDWVQRIFSFCSLSTIECIVVACEVRFATFSVLRKPFQPFSVRFILSNRNTDLYIILDIVT